MKILNPKTQTLVSVLCNSEGVTAGRPAFQRLYPSIFELPEVNFLPDAWNPLAHLTRVTIHCCRKGRRFSKPQVWVVTSERGGVCLAVPARTPTASPNSQKPSPKSWGGREPSWTSGSACRNGKKISKLGCECQIEGDRVWVCFFFFFVTVCVFERERGRV